MQFSCCCKIVLVQIATLIRHSPFDSDNLYFNSGNKLYSKFNTSAERHLPPNHGGRPWCGSPL